MRKRREDPDFAAMILDNLHTANVQQAHKENKIEFSSLEPWLGKIIVAEELYSASEEKESKGKQDTEIVEKRAAIFVGPEYETVSQVDLAAAAREAVLGSFNVLVISAFNYDAQASDLNKIGRLPILKAWMNADLHMADLKNIGKGNLFVIFGEPDVTVTPAVGLQIRRARW